MARGTNLYYISGVLGIIDTTAVLLRFVARGKSKAKLGVDDVFIACSLVPLYGMIVSSVLLVTKGGVGRSIATLTPTEFSTFLKVLMGTMITYSFAITCVKMSVLLLYRRIFITASFRRVSVIVGIACLLWFIIEFFMDVFQCRPFKAAFEPFLLFTDQCIDLQSFYWGVTIANLGLDVVILYMPLYMVWGLQLPTKQRLTLAGIFLLGGLSCIAGIMRVVTIGNIQKEDLTLSSANEYIWSQIEPATAILCACLVTYRPLFADMNFIHKFSKLSSNLTLSRRARPKVQDWTDMESSRDMQMQWAVARDFPGNNQPSQSNDDDAPICGRCEPVILKPFDLPAATLPTQDLHDGESHFERNAQPGKDSA